jgi:hypothetical protein
MVWANSARTLSSFGTLVADIWSYVTRTLTSGGGGGGGATAAEIWSYATRTLTAFGSNGLNEFTYTLIDGITSQPIANVVVRISTDNAGVNVVWVGSSDAFGVARDAYGQKPRLAAGAYYFWRELAGYIFADPDVETVG